jgi:hypothetical protein
MGHILLGRELAFIFLGSLVANDYVVPAPALRDPMVVRLINQNSVAIRRL